MSHLIDLHCHTNCSDGSLSPHALLERAGKSGVRILAITDHDTIEAYTIVRDAAEISGTELFCGVELSTHLSGCERSVHLLGYFPSQPGAEFCTWLQELQRGRVERNMKLLAKLQELGFDIHWDEVQVLAQRQVGRPHFAAILQRKGYVKTLKEAFERYLSEDGMAWVDRDEPSLADSLVKVRKAGGLTSLAHPVRISRDWNYLAQIIRYYARSGLDALECFHSEHSKEETKKLLALAQMHALRVTGGSDFHGGAKPDIEIGRGRNGNVLVPAYVAQQLVEKFTEAGLNKQCKTERTSDNTSTPRCHS